MTDTLTTSANTTQEDLSISVRINKTGRTQMINMIEPKTAPPKVSTTRKTRGKFFVIKIRDDSNKIL